MTKNTKITIALLSLAGLFLAYKKGVFNKKEDAERGLNPDADKNTNVDTSLPVVSVSSGAESPQVVTLPPQFTQPVTASVSEVPGSYATYRN